MKVDLNLTKEQSKFLQDHPDFNLQGWFSNALNDKIGVEGIRREKKIAVIAAAGSSSRMPKEGVEVPIAMLKIRGKSLLQRQIEILRSFDINDVTVIRGYEKERFTIADVNYINNNEYDKTSILYSFLLASNEIRGKSILLYGDILFERELLKKLIEETSDFSVIVDRSWREHYHSRVQHTISEAELVEVEDGSILRMGRGIPYDSAYGEFIGLAALSPRGSKKVRNLFDGLKHEPDKTSLGGKSLSKASLTDFFNALIERGEKITPVDTFGGWFEIDTFEDYRKSWTMVNGKGQLSE